MRRKEKVINIFNPKGNTWTSYVLKHWHGKRVTFKGRYGKISGCQVDVNLNFVCWIVKMKGNFQVKLSDPNFRPSFLPK